jgi:cell division protein FtsB
MYTNKYTPKDADNNFQNDSLRLEIKRLESHIKSLNDALNHQNEKIQSITTFLKQKEKDNDKFVEINDRIDDLESRINLLDE